MAGCLKNKTTKAVLFVLLCALGLVLLAFACLPKEKSGAAAAAFFDALCAQDHKTAEELLLGGESLSHEGYTEPGAAKLAAAWRESLRYTLEEDGRVHWRRAVQTVQLQMLDLPALTAELASEMESEAQTLERTLPRSEAVGEDGAYRRSFLELLYNRAVDALLSHAEDYTTEMTLRVPLRYVSGAWKIAADDQLLAVLRGMELQQLQEQMLSAAHCEPITLGLDDGLAPEAAPEGYGTTADPAVIERLLESKVWLLDGQSTVWMSEVELVEGSEYQYYSDESILVLTWKERINRRICTCTEVKIADASQLRRKLTDDTFDSATRLPTSAMAEQTNAVLAVNGDFYAFRRFGTCVYDGELLRFDNKKLDTCFFDRGGNMLLLRAGALQTEQEAKQYIKDNDILFSLAFWPILIENGEKEKLRNYSVGESLDRYPRAAVGMKGELHYFFLHVDSLSSDTNAVTWQEFANIVATKGLASAYTLDGGGTGEVYFYGEVLNRAESRREREVSDMIYFVTAIED